MRYLRCKRRNSRYNESVPRPKPVRAARTVTVPMPSTLFTTKPQSHMTGSPSSTATPMRGVIPNVKNRTVKLCWIYRDKKRVIQARANVGVLNMPSPETEHWMESVPMQADVRIALSGWLL